MEFEIEFEVNDVIWPLIWPVKLGDSRSGALKRVTFFAEPVPAVILHVTNPTGSVVAVTFCALVIGRAARTAAAARVSEVDFILMEFDDFLFGLWKWVGASGEFLKPVAGVFWLAVLYVSIIC